MTELENKLSRVYELLDQHNLDALYLARISSFAWATCGAASYINTATTTGEASLLITRSGRYLITNNIEAPHYEFEEKLKEQGWEFVLHPWFQNSQALERMAAGLRLGADVCMPGAVDLSEAMAVLRMNLEPEEQQRYRDVSRRTADAMEEAARAVRPGMNEMEIAGLLAKACFDRTVQPIVNLVATDERIYNFRHPLPVDKKLEKYAMLVVCGRKYGLITSCTRLVHFGTLPDEIQKKQALLAQIDAQVISATRPGQTIDGMFRVIQNAYADAGYPEEYRLHHQGGSAAYEPREFLAKPGVDVQVRAGQVYAWNPSITGCKVEDTILINETGCEVLTEMAGWPALEVTVNGQIFRRPAVLEI